MLARATTVAGLLVFATVACHAQRRDAAVANAPAPSDAELRQATCLGPVNASRFAVYLHGIDAASIGDQELGNRRALARVAEELGMRIALPRAAATCGAPGAVCWGGGPTPDEIIAAAPQIAAAAEACFAGAPFGIIGFSNGGSLATALLRRCELRTRVPRARWIVSVGAAMFKGPLEPEPASLAGCGTVVFLVGTRDAYDPADNYDLRLRGKAADVRTVRFDGGHEVLAEPLVGLLRELSP